MGQHHRHVAGELAAATLQQQGQPGSFRIGPQGPKPQLGNFRQLPGVVVGTGPIEVKLQGTSLLDKGIRAKAEPGLESCKIQLADLALGNLHRGHQEL